MVLRLTLILLLAVPLLGTSMPAAAKPAKKRPTVKTAKKKVRRVKAKKRRTRRRRARRRVRGCRGIFCTAQVVRMDGSGKAQRALTEEQVERVAQTAQKPLEPCLIQARRRDPEMVRARVEVVVNRKGRILASRVNGKRRNSIARCIHRKLRGVRFPKSGLRRQVAAFTISIPH